MTKIGVRIAFAFSQVNCVACRKERMMKNTDKKKKKFMILRKFIYRILHIYHFIG